MAAFSQRKKSTKKKPSKSTSNTDQLIEQVAKLMVQQSAKINNIEARQENKKEEFDRRILLSGNLPGIGGSQQHTGGPTIKETT